MTTLGRPVRREEPIPEVSIVFERVSRSLVVGLHPTVKALYERLSTPPLRQVPPRTLTDEDVADLLESFPIRVCREEHRLRCTGNVRLFQLALRYLPENAAIPCLIEPALPEASLTRRALKELLHGTACLGAHFSDEPLAKPRR